MALRILWHPPRVPEERKKVQWEKIIRLQLGESAESLDVSLQLAEDHHRWRVDTSGASPEYLAAYRGQLVNALRSAGKPVE
jgi:hypothetical protein